VAKSGYAVVVVRGGCMPRITIYIDRRTYGALEVIASQRGLEVSALIKEAIKKYVENFVNRGRK
jgi:predicted transcriptional regulator